MCLHRTRRRLEPIKDEQGNAFNGTYAAHTVQSIVTPVLLFLGIVGNVISFTMMRRRSMRGITTCFYISCLSVADLFCVCFGLLPVFLRVVSNGSVNARFWLDCKLMDFMTYVSTDVSIWIVVVMTLDRYIATCHPVNSLKWCNKRVAKRSVIIIALVMLTLNFHLAAFYTFGVEEDEQLKETDIPDCIPVRTSGYFFHHIWPWIDFSVYTLSPVLIIFSFNTLIIRSIIKRRKRIDNEAARNFRRQTYKMTKTLLAVSTVMMICTTPITVIQIAEEYTDEHEDTISWNLAFAIGNLLMYTNHSINFLLYCLTGSRFRRELASMFGFRTYNNTHTSTMDTRQDRAIEETIT